MCAVALLHFLTMQRVRLRPTTPFYSPSFHRLRTRPLPGAVLANPPVLRYPVSSDPTLPCSDSSYSSSSPCPCLFGFAGEFLSFLPYRFTPLRMYVYLSFDIRYLRILPTLSCRFGFASDLLRIRLIPFVFDSLGYARTIKWL